MQIFANLTHRIRLYPNNVQATYFAKAAGVARFAWNWGLARWNEMYKAGQKPSWQKINAELNGIKHEQFPWMIEVTKWAPNKAMNDLGDGFANSFRRAKKGEKFGHPRFKKKGRCKEGFYVAGAELNLDKNKIKVPKLGWVRTAEVLRFPGKVLGVRFSRSADKWFVSIQVEVDGSKWSYPHLCKNQAVVGIDLGLVHLAVPSKGESIDAPRALRFYEQRLKRLQRELARRTKGGSNYQKTRVKLQKVHEKISNIRKDVTHKLTSGLVRNYRWIGIEDLSIKSMIKNHRLAKSIADAALSEVRRQLEYKAALSGSTVVVADRWYPSSKTCSSCGFVLKELPLSVRRWTCLGCGINHDRDLNAAKNLESLATGYVVNACGEGSSDNGHVAVVKLPSVKQESSNRLFVKEQMV